MHATTMLTQLVWDQFVALQVDIIWQLIRTSAEAWICGWGHRGRYHFSKKTPGLWLSHSCSPPSASGTKWEASLVWPLSLPQKHKKDDFFKMIKFLKSSEKKAGCVRRKFRWLWCQIWCHDDKPTNSVLLHKVARRCLEWVLGFVHKPVETSTCLLIRAKDWLKWLYSNTQSSARIIRLNRI